MTFRVFVSSVQKELENERLAVAETVAMDPFLQRNVEPVLFEQLPASTAPAESAYLDALHGCHAYIGVLGFEYGRRGGDGLSAVHREYREAKRMGLPVFIFIKGESALDSRRDAELVALLDEVRDERHGHVYKRFTHYQSLKTEVRRALLSELERGGVRPNSEEESIAVQTLAQASDFDSVLVERLTLDDLDPELMARLAGSATGRDGSALSPSEVQQTLLNRGLVWRDDDAATLRPSAAGVLLLGKRPDEVYPQARIAANAYGGVEKGDPLDRDDIREPLPRAVERAFQFLKRNMRHTTRVEGFARLQIDEYPYEALREAVVNAVAHRDYALTGSCIRLDKYVDRIEVMSPGLPPAPITLEKIERLNYMPCSRNPNVARGLSFFERIEEQGDGLRRIVTSAQGIGLPRPEFRFRDGHFLVIFKGPGDDILKLKSQAARALVEIQNDSLSHLNASQRHILGILLRENEVKVPALAAQLSVSEQAVRKALKGLVEEGLVVKSGQARETSYRLKATGT
ncbi:MAG: ATP-binding protein [bacterium]